jgi:ankyrin repeat protein
VGAVEALLAGAPVAATDAHPAVPGVDVELDDTAGRTALLFATKSNHIACVHQLLKHGASPVDKVGG